MTEESTNLEIRTPPRTFIVKTYDITLKSGHTASFVIRPDKDETCIFPDLEDVEQDPWIYFAWPSQKRTAQILYTEVAGINFVEHELKETPKLKKPNAEAPATA